MNKGWIKVSRESILIHEDELTQCGKPFSRFEAFLWMVSKAEFEGPGRGSFQTSLATLSESFGWTRQVLRTWIEKLENNHRITTERNHQITTVTIVNYDSYQGEQPTKKPQKNKRITTEANLTIFPKEDKNKEIGSKDPMKEKSELVPRMWLSEEDRGKLKAEFGGQACTYYLPICSDWLVANGKTKKDCAAFMRNWVRKEQSERKGFFYPKKDGYKPHTAANTTEKNLEYIRTHGVNENGPETFDKLLDLIGKQQEEFGVITLDSGIMVHSPKRLN